MRELTQNEIEQVSGSGFHIGGALAIGLGVAALVGIAAVGAVALGVTAVALYKKFHNPKPGPCGCQD